jgi:hypothetical protein
MGKSTAKAERNDGYANEIDLRLRNLQDGQTLGIPVGPDASLVIAEIIGTAIDFELQEHGLKGFRFMDDFEFVFPTRGEAEVGLARLECELAKFELAINPRKTSIEELPTDLERPWLSGVRRMAGDAEQQLSALWLIEYFNTIFDLKRQFPYDPVLAFGIACLRSAEIERVTNNTTWELFQSLLAQSALAEHGAMEALLFFLNKAEDRRDLNPIRDLICLILARDTSLTHGSEIVWALWTAIWLNIKLPASLVSGLDGDGDSTIAVLALHAQEKGLIEGTAEFHSWRTRMTRAALYHGDWLLAYEADIRRWLPSVDTPSHVSADKNFEPLKRAGVSFFNPDIENPTRSALVSGLISGSDPSDL